MDIKYNNTCYCHHENVNMIKKKWEILLYCSTMTSHFYRLHAPSYVSAYISKGN